MCGMCGNFIKINICNALKMNVLKCGRTTTNFGNAYHN